MQERLQRAEQAVLQGVADGRFPGAVIHVRVQGQTVWQAAYGDAEVAPVRRPLTSEHLFDVASLTKVMATLPAVLRTVQVGRLALEQPIGDLLPQWKQAPITVQHVLTHTSGLPAWKPFYLKAQSPQQYLDLIAGEPLEQPPGTKVVYSDLGLMLLGFLLEHVWQQPLHEVCDQLVFQPFGLQQTGYQLGQTPRERFTATEQGNAYEQAMCFAFADQCERDAQDAQRHRAPRDARDVLSTASFTVTRQDVEQFAWRTDTICGQVHDGNAWYGLQGCAGHAGLFATAADVARSLSIWRNGGILDGVPLLDRRLVQLATSNQTPHLNIARCLGFEAAPIAGTAQATVGCTAGPDASARAYGHTGFTGTSMWHDPHTDTEAVVLTQRVHPHAREGMPAWRRTFHSILFS